MTATFALKFGTALPREAVSMRTRRMIARTTANRVAQVIEKTDEAIRVTLANNNRQRRYQGRDAVDRSGFLLLVSRVATSAQGIEYLPAGEVLIAWDGGTTSREETTTSASVAVVAPPTLAAVARCSRYRISHHDLWIVNADSLTDCTLLPPQHVLHLGFVPEIGAKYSFAGRRYEVVDGAEYATHGDPRGELSP